MNKRLIDGSMFKTSEGYASVPGTFSSEGLTSSREAGLTKAWNQRAEELAAIGYLRDDWDGLGATAPSPQVVAGALEFMQIIRGRRESIPPTNVSAGPNGTVLLAWDFGVSYWEAEVTHAHAAEWMYCLPSGASETRKESWEAELDDENAHNITARTTYYKERGDVGISVLAE